MTGTSELDPRERGALRSLRRDASPDPALEDRVVEALRGEGLLGRRRFPRAFAWAAVLAGVFLAGVTVGDRRAGDPGTVGRAGYVLLLREGPSYNSAATPQAERERVAEYAGWARELAAEGRFVDGEKLTAEERLVVAPGADEADRGGPITGYFILESKSYQEAVRIARDSPHVRYGGSVEVRQIERAAR